MGTGEVVVAFLRARLRAMVVGCGGWGGRGWGGVCVWFSVMGGGEGKAVWVRAECG